MNRKKAKGLIEMPKDLSAIILLDTVEDVKNLKEVLQSRRPQDFLIVSGGLSILYNKAQWGIVET